MRAWLGVMLLVGPAVACGFDAPGAMGVDGPARTDADVDAPGDGPTMPFDVAPSACLARWAVGPAVDFEPPTPVSFNTNADERDPMIGPADGRLYFSARRDSAATNEIYSAAPDASGHFDAPVLEVGLSTANEDDGKLSMTNDELFAVGTHRGGAAHNHMIPYTRSSTLESWAPGDPATVRAPHETDNPNLIDSLDSEISGDGLQLFFARQVGTRSSQSIWVASRASRAVAFPAAVAIFTDPMDRVNYADPALSVDSRVFLFTASLPYVDSIGTPRLDRELYYEYRADPEGDLQLITPIRIPSVGSSSDDGDAALSPDGCTLYFASKRDGNYNIYAAKLRMP